MCDFSLLLTNIWIDRRMDRYEDASKNRQNFVASKMPKMFYLRHAEHHAPYTISTWPRSQNTIMNDPLLSGSSIS